MNDTLKRFVVLHHETGTVLNRTADDHLDWMFDTDPQSPLRTFATPILKRLDQPFEITAESIANHRRAYLDYQGGLSGDRGTVTRVASGTFQLIEQTADRFHVAIHPQTNIGSNPERSIEPIVPGQLLFQKGEPHLMTVGETSRSWAVRFTVGL